MKAVVEGVPMSEVGTFTRGRRFTKQDMSNRAFPASTTARFTRSTVSPLSKRYRVCAKIFVHSFALHNQATS